MASQPVNEACPPRDDIITRPKCPYAVGETLSLQLNGQESTDISVIKIFEPFTMSCAMVVQLDHPVFKGHFVLKLYDRRFATQLRGDEEASPWCPQIESNYCELVREGHVSGFFNVWAAKYREDVYWTPDESETWDIATCEAYLQYLCLRTYHTEREAYDKLHDIQGKHVPHLLARAWLYCSSDSDSTHEFLCCPGILLEYIQGFPLHDIATNISEDKWQDICEDAIRVVHLVGDRGICNRDVRTRSFIVQEDPGTKNFHGHMMEYSRNVKTGTKSFSVYMTDFGLCIFRSQCSNDREFNEWQANEDEEGAVGCVMEKMLKGGFKYRRSARAMWLLDEFKRE